MTRLKTIKVNNNSNVLVQIPRFVGINWNIQDGDELEMVLSDDGQSIIVKPLPKRSGSNKES